MRRLPPHPRALFLLCFASLLLAGCAPSASPHKFTTAHQAVFMDNGQVFFGKLEQMGGDYPLLRNVFTVQNQADPATKEVKSALVNVNHAQRRTVPLALRERGNGGEGAIRAQTIHHLGWPAP